VVDKSLTLLGANAGVADDAVRGPESVIDGNDSNENYYVVDIEADNVTFDGFEVKNAAYSGSADATGILIDSGSRNSNIRVANNKVHNIGATNRPAASFGTFGIQSGHVNGLEIDHNAVYNIGNADASSSAIGILIYGNDSIDNANNVNIHHNAVHDISNPASAAAIWTGSDSQNDTVDHNTVSNAGIGIHASLGMGSAAIITNTTIGAGITVTGIEEFTAGAPRCSRAAKLAS
jgi:hypothetical protein